MTKATLLKLALVVGLTAAGFGLSQPAEGYLHPCSESYCSANGACLCRCVEGDGKTYVCDEAPPMCFT